MPTTATKSTKSTTGTRKTRTRRSTAKKATPAKAVKLSTTKPQPVEKPVENKVTVTTFKSGKAVKKVTTLKRPSTARLISPSRYMQDIKTRWMIHNFEIQELVRDFKSGFKAVQPYHAEAVKTVKAWTV